MGRQEEIVKERLKKLDILKKKKISPYPSKSNASNRTSELQEEYKDLEPGESTKKTAKIAGRVMSLRDMGKIAFATVFDGFGKIQIVLQEEATPAKTIEFFREIIEEGDFIGAEGNIQRTKRGELSILVKDISILSKSLYPLPDKWHGVKEDEERLRRRYLEILMNEDTRNMFVRKAKFWGVVRNFLLNRDFLEVETPVLENSAGGASATPFKTHHNALDLDVYLRISMGELWQKKLMVAGYPKTFEIGRQFRNEGMDAEHLQDYTQMEFYWAYANYEDGMKLVEELYRTIAKEVFGKTVFTVGEHTFDLSKKWERIDYVESIKKKFKIDVLDASLSELKKKLDSLHVEYERGAGKGRLMDLLWKQVRKDIAGPAFLTGQPVDVTPLAKRDSKDPRKVEQFQIILGGSEIGNGYSELNDPLDQEERFKEQRKLKEGGDSEAHEHDEGFIEALKYGMPPTCGFGFSERLFAFLEGKPLRETVIFPLMRPSQEEKKEEHGRPNHKK